MRSGGLVVLVPIVFGVIEFVSYLLHWKPCVGDVVSLFGYSY